MMSCKPSTIMSNEMSGSMQLGDLNLGEPCFMIV